MRIRRFATYSLGVAYLTAWPAPEALGEPVGVRAGAAASVGSPTDGALVGGVALRERAELRLRWPDGPRWALPVLVSMLERAARHVDRRYPGSILLVGDLSGRIGGSLSGHVSHESGRDADVGFYYADALGRVFRTERLLPVRASGSAPVSGLRFDDPRNWTLIEALLTDGEVVVQKIFVADPLKRRLLEYGRRHRASADVLLRAEAAMRQPARGAPHDDHFHVRIACPHSPANHCVSEPERLPPAPSAVHERTAALGPTER
jgi:penicillin-insensitive murein endopeptidase